ncbi:IS21-like element helper ATPase IstB [Desulfosarcina sp.]|nr:IS21-like element helper ATPase IstB [Desulfosarcina sp.]
MTTKKKLHELVDILRLAGIKMVLAEELARAEKNGCPHSELLYRLLAAEHAHRQQRSLLYRLQQAKIPVDWTLESFPFKLQPTIQKSQIMSLAQLDFIGKAQNIVLIGNPGTGKTGLAAGLLRKALVAGYRGRFYNAQDLLDELYTSLADRYSPRLIKKLSRYDLLVIDELGYLTLNPEQVNAFFKLMEQRYGQKSTIVTTNLDYDQWYDLFANKPLVDALLDRLRHHCITVKINGPSLRKPEHIGDK